MPIAKKWSNFKKENVKEVPDVYGVYELANEAKSTVYIGEGNSGNVCLHILLVVVIQFRVFHTLDMK